ncbi:MAG: sugar ABC transporter permease [Lachnospiraceae bacterium]|nr:sugar ABC transporter permease [Lachnospiraceae bacterium]
MKSKKYDGVTIFLFLLPALLLFVGILVAPMASSAINSFYQYKGFGQKTWLGWDNYKRLFNKDFPAYIPFKDSVVHALLLAGFSVFIQLPLALGLALLLGRGIKGERFFLSVNFLPVLISTVVIGQLWLKIFDPRGLLNSLLRLVGYLKEGDDNIQWLAEGQGKLLYSCFIPMLWQYVGYHMLLMYAGVKSVPTELREAAKIDGATDWQVDRFVVIPSMKQIVKVSVIFAITGSLKSYDLIRIIAMNLSTKDASVPSTILMDYMTLRGEYGVASAVAVLLILLCFFFAILISTIFKERD